jgi:FdhD protein
MGTSEHPTESSSSEKVGSIPVSVFDREGNRIDRPQWVINEQPVTLVLNGREMVTLLCAGHHLEELAVGFFHSDGFIGKLEDLERVSVDEAAGKVEVVTRKSVPLAERLWEKRTVTSGCGKGSMFYYSLDALLSKPVEGGPTATPAKILERVEDLNRLSDTYRHTHGVHNTALATKDEVLLFRDDIGRHNAVDMIVGHVFLQGISLKDKMLITTGRLTSEMLIKAAKVGIPILVSRNTATTLAVELATSMNITLIGYARAGKFIVYAGKDRIDEGHRQE